MSLSEKQFIKELKEHFKEDAWPLDYSYHLNVYRDEVVFAYDLVTNFHRILKSLGLDVVNNQIVKVTNIKKPKRNNAKVKAAKNRRRKT